LFRWALGDLSNLWLTVWHALDNQSSGNKDGFFEWVNQVLEAGKWNDEMWKDLLIGGKFNLCVFFTEFLNIEQLLWLFINGILTVMSPDIVFEVNFLDLVGWVDRQTIYGFFFKENVDISLDLWVQLSISGNLRDQLVVEVGVDELPFKQLAVWQVGTDSSHSILGFQNLLRRVTLHL